MQVTFGDAPLAAATEGRGLVVVGLRDSDVTQEPGGVGPSARRALQRPATVSFTAVQVAADWQGVLDLLFAATFLAAQQDLVAGDITLADACLVEANASHFGLRVETLWQFAGTSS